MLKKSFIIICVFTLTCAFAVTYFMPDLRGNVSLYFNSYSSMAVEKEYSPKNIFNVRRTGECATYLLNQTDKEKIFNGLFADEVFSEKIVEGTSYYGYSKKIRNFKVINGEKVNVQVFVGKEYIKVGIPIIYGSF